MSEFDVVEICEFWNIVAKCGFSTLWRNGGFSVKKWRIPWVGR